MFSSSCPPVEEAHMKAKPKRRISADDMWSIPDMVLPPEEQSMDVSFNSPPRVEKAKKDCTPVKRRTPRYGFPRDCIIVPPFPFIPVAKAPTGVFKTPEKPHQL
jgi:hypothetical protein